MRSPISFRNTDANQQPITRQILRHLSVTLITAGILATLFTAWTPASLNPGELANQFAAALEGDSGSNAPSIFAPSAPEEEELRIGLVIGHSGINPSTGADDPGSVCEDGLQELDVNTKVGNLTAQALEAAGLQVDVLEEFDSRLFEYRAVAVMSIHVDSCVPINEYASGFKVVSAQDTVVPDKSQRLVDCIIDRYHRATELNFHAGSITRDMTEYHTFREIHSQTPAAIIETGFLYLDREFLTSQPEKVARGIADGILCYVNNEPASLPWETTP